MRKPRQAKSTTSTGHAVGGGRRARRHNVAYRTAVDTLDDLSRAVDECLEQDLLVFSGGSSVGHGGDLIMDVIGTKGEVLFRCVGGCKPGKPTAFGRDRGQARVRP